MLMTLSDLKAALGISGSADDAFLTQWGAIITDAIEVYCRRKLLAHDVVETIYRDDIANTDTLHLYNYPLNTLTSIELDGEALTDVRVKKDSSRLFRKDGLFTNGNELVITYNAGYITLPPLIQYVYVAIIQEKYNRKKAGVDLNFGTDVQRISIPSTISIDFDYSLTNNEATNEMANLLGNYLNVLSQYRSELAITPLGKITYVN